MQDDTANNETTTEKTKPTKPQKKPTRAPDNSRGPTPGKYQNGKVCFSYWFPTPFLVRLRRYATNLGMDIPSLLLSDYSGRLSNLPLTDSDRAEIELSNKSIRS